MKLATESEQAISSGMVRMSSAISSAGSLVGSSLAGMASDLVSAQQSMANYFAVIQAANAAVPVAIDPVPVVDGLQPGIDDGLLQLQTLGTKAQDISAPVTAKCDESATLSANAQAALDQVTALPDRLKELLSGVEMHLQEMANYSLALKEVSSQAGPVSGVVQDFGKKLETTLTASGGDGGAMHHDALAQIEVLRQQLVANVKIEQAR
jgi:hypothetical protein